MVVADDQDLVRAGFVLLIDSAPGLAVVGQAVDGAQAVELALTEQPDVVLMDVRMPGTDGITATQTIAAGRDTAGVRVIMLTTFDLDEYVYAALQAGASGFLLKDTRPEDLLQAIAVVAGGDALLAPSVTRRLIAQFARQSSAPSFHPPALNGLTDRERQVLGLVAAGLSNQEIAQHLYVSIPTTKTHISRLLTKLHARDRAQLVIAAYETGLTVPRPA